MSYTPKTVYVDTVGDTMTGDLTIAANSLTIDAASTAFIVLDKGTASNFGQFEFRTAGAQTWAVGTTNSGENFHIYDASIGFDALAITNSTGLATVKGDPTANLGIATKQYVDNKQGYFWATIPSFSVASGVNVNPGSLTVQSSDTGFYSVSGGQVTVSKGTYFIITVMLTGVNGGGRNFISIEMSTGTVYRSSLISGEDRSTVTALVPMSAGQYFRAAVYQASGAAQSWSGILTAYCLGL